MRKMVVVILLVALLLSAGVSCAAVCGQALSVGIAGVFDSLFGEIPQPGIEGGEGGSIH